MNFKKGKSYCDKLLAGIDEVSIINDENIDIEELYRVVEFTDIDIARSKLKYFCKGYINYMCLCWPGYDEKLCPVSGYEKNCPLKDE